MGIWMIQIHSIEDERVALFANLSEHELKHYNEPEPGYFIAESPKVILRALDAGYEPVAILMESPDKYREPLVSEVLDKVHTGYGESVPCYYADDEVLSKLTGIHLTRGMLCAIKRRGMLNDDASFLESDNARRIAVLESVVNPTNMGAIIRSAAALGIDGFLLTADCVDPLYRRCLRVSMGNVFSIPWAYIPEGNSVCSYAHAKGFKCAAMALDDRCIGLEDSKLKECDKLAIVLGNEGLGLSQKTIEEADFIVKIPMAREVDSLNVAAASAIAFWELV